MAKIDPHIAGGIRHDWPRVKHDYITDPHATLRKIADKYGIQRATVYARSAREGWFEERKKVQAKISEKALAKTTDRIAKELSAEADFLMLMKGHMNKMLRDTEQFQRHIVTEGSETSYGAEERVFDKYDTRAMKDAMSSLKMMEEMTRSLYNLQKADAILKQKNDAERLEIERERLALEKERIALEKERNALRSQNLGADEDSNYGVVLMPEVLTDE